VRGAIFSVLGPDSVDGERVLDLFAGTGALGIEALSRGASGADFVEADRRLAQRLRENLALLNLADICEVHRVRVERVVGKLDGPYGLVFADPPYGAVDLEVLLRSLDEHNLVKTGGRLVIEHSARDALTGSCGNLSRIEERRYGDTSVSIYSSGVAVGKSDLSG
jgi:16S rRNA (guanine(966)-N(2))-methyltransferase RsmD